MHVPDMEAQLEAVSSKTGNWWMHEASALYGYMDIKRQRAYYYI